MDVLKKKVLFLSHTCCCHCQSSTTSEKY